jgi:guanylate kinase
MKNELRNLDEFEAILKNYQMSELANEILGKVQMIVLTAPTSSGRNTIIRELMKTGYYHFVVSDTTRLPRVNDGVMELNGREYWFKDEVEVLEGLKRGEYLEAAIIHNQQVSGINVNEIVISYNNSKIALGDIEVQGVESLLKIKPDLISIFVLPPSFDEWMRRLKSRGHMHNDEFKRRLISALNEFEYALKSDNFIFVINDVLDDIVSHIQLLVKQESADINYQNDCIKLVKNLHQEVKNLLSTLD